MVSVWGRAAALSARPFSRGHRKPIAQSAMVYRTQPRNMRRPQKLTKQSGVRFPVSEYMVKSGFFSSAASCLPDLQRGLQRGLLRRCSQLPKTCYGEFGARIRPTQLAAIDTPGNSWTWHETLRLRLLRFRRTEGPAINLNNPCDLQFTLKTRAILPVSILLEECMEGWTIFNEAVQGSIPGVRMRRNVVFSPAFPLSLDLRVQPEIFTFSQMNWVLQPATREANAIRLSGRAYKCFPPVPLTDVAEDGAGTMCIQMYPECAIPGRRAERSRSTTASRVTALHCRRAQSLRRSEGHDASHIKYYDSEYAP